MSFVVVLFCGGSDGVSWWIALTNMRPMRSSAQMLTKRAKAAGQSTTAASLEKL